MLVGGWVYFENFILTMTKANRSPVCNRKKNEIIEANHCASPLGQVVLVIESEFDYESECRFDSAGMLLCIWLLAFFLLLLFQVFRRSLL